MASWQRSYKTMSG